MAEDASSTDLSYGPPGATRPACESWTEPAPPRFRRFEGTVVLGHGDEVWADAASEVLSWGIKRRSGFRVSPANTVVEGSVYQITASWGPFAVHEPVQVVAVVNDPDRCSFAYGTSWGHPVSGEEAFVVHRNPDGAVILTLRSLTRPAPTGLWRPAFPFLLVAQRFYRRRYQRALISGA